MSETNASTVYAFTASKSTFLISLIAILSLPASHQHERPRIVSWPSHPVIGTRLGDATFNWTFTLWPGKTWNDSVEEVGFGIWKAPGYLKKKLIVISKRGNVLIRPNYEDKLSCKFNMSRLLVAFTLHNLSMEDVKEYGLHVEFGLAQNPLMDAVMLRLQGPPQATSFPKGNTDIFTTKEVEKTTQTAVTKTIPSEDTSYEWKPLVFIIGGAAILIIFISMVVILVCFRGKRRKSIPYGPQVDTSVI